MDYTLGQVNKDIRETQDGLGPQLSCVVKNISAVGHLPARLASTGICDLVRIEVNFPTPRNRNKNGCSLKKPS